MCNERIFCTRAFFGCPPGVFTELRSLAEELAMDAASSFSATLSAMLTAAAARATLWVHLLALGDALLPPRLGAADPAW